MKLILKENPDTELTVTVEYPKESAQVSRIIQKLQSEEAFLIGSENGRSYKVRMPEIFYIESVDKRTFVYTKESVFRSEKGLFPPLFQLPPHGMEMAVIYFLYFLRPDRLKPVHRSCFPRV